MSGIVNHTGAVSGVIGSKSMRQSSISSFHIGSTGGWDTWQNEKVDHFTVSNSYSGHPHNVGNNYVLASSHYIAPIDGLYVIYLMAYTFWDDTAGHFYVAIDDSVIANQADGMLMNTTSATPDKMFNFSQIFEGKAGDVFSIRAQSNTSDMHGGNSWFGGWLVCGT